MKEEHLWEKKRAIRSDIVGCGDVGSGQTSKRNGREQEIRLETEGGRKMIAKRVRRRWSVSGSENRLARGGGESLWLSNLSHLSY
jgi:hypothetical protein